MKSRVGMFTVAGVVALVAAILVLMYVKGVQRTAAATGGEVSVVVAKDDIPAGTSFDTVIAGGGFTTLSIPPRAVVPGAITDLAQLRGRYSSAGILQGEQITTARLRGSQQLPGGTLGLPSGYQALTLLMPAQQAVGGQLQQGDHVTVYGNFTHTDSGAPASVVLVPDVAILQLSVSAGAESSQLITMAFTPEDAQRIIFAQGQGTVWLTLLGPNQHGAAHPPVHFQQVIK